MRVGQNVYYIHKNKKCYGKIVEENHFHYFIGRYYLKVDKFLVFNTSGEADQYIYENKCWFARLLDWWSN